VAFEALEKPVLERGYAILDQLIDKRTNIIFEHSGAREDHLDILERAKNKGYKIIITSVIHPIELTKIRVHERNQKGQRYTPLSYVEERTKILEKLEPSYQLIADHFIKKYEDISMEDIIDQIVEVLK
jgi:predicted ABC-type ATPase